jgi:hypothetical protein
MLTLIVALKAVTEIALLALAGQALLGLLAGAGRDRNPVYRLLELLSRPPRRVARWISPRVVLDRHVPLVAFVLLVWAWLALTAVKLSVCLPAGGHACP